MPRRWSVGLISIGVALNALLFGWLLRRRSRSRAAQSTLDQAMPSPAALAPQPDLPSARPIIPLPPAPAATPATLMTSSRRFQKSNILLRVAIGLLLIAAIGLAVQAQSIFSVELWEDRDAGIPYALAAMIAFSAVAYLTGRWLGKAHDITDCPTAPHTTNAPAQTAVVAEIRSGVKQHPWRTIGVIASSGLWFIVLGNLRIDPPLPDYTLTLIMWLAAIVLFAVSIIIPSPRPRRDWKAWWAQNWLLIVAVSAIGTLALALRVINLDMIPPTLSGDEGAQGVEALKVLQGELLNPFVNSWMSVPTLSFFFNSLTIGPLGHTAFALRLPWSLIGTTTVLIMLALTWRLKGRALALMVGVLLATYHYHIHYSRLGSNQVADAFFMAAAFFFLYCAYDEGGMRNWVMAGLVAGMAQYFYTGARFVTILVGVTLVYFVVRDRLMFLRTHWRGLLALGAIFLISAGPMLQFSTLQPDEYNGRINAVGIYQSGWLEREVQITGRSAPDLLLDQFKRAVLAYNAYPDRTTWYASPHPLFDGGWAILFMLGLGYATLRPFDRRLFPMLIWWWGAIILGGMLTESPPSSQRLITSAPPAVFFVALAVWQLGQILQRLFHRPAPTSADLPSRPAVAVRTRRYILPALMVVTVVGLSWISARWYFVEYTPLRVYGNYTAVTADALIRYVQAKLDPSYRMVFFGAPQMYIEFGSIKYLLPEITGQDIPEPLTAPFDPTVLLDDKQPVFFFMPFRYPEFTFVQQTYPNGYVEELASPVPGAIEPLLYVYRIAK